MILEVNNTFDERRLYFLKNGDANEDSTLVEEVNVDSSPGCDHASHLSMPASKSSRFITRWSKDFHVSPFNSRKGSYSLSAIDPFNPSMQGLGQINNTITLNSSKHHAKLVARAFSTGPPIKPLELTRRTTARFILSWWWVGFITFPRIVKEAGRLFFKRKLHVWYRPEVLKESIGRRETHDERIIEAFFRQFLEFKVKHSNLMTSLKYTASGSQCRKIETFYPTHLEDKTLTNRSKAPLELKILTPLFYARFIQYAHASEFLTLEILSNDEKNRTFWTSDPQSLLSLFSDALPKNPTPQSDPIKPTNLPYLDRQRWNFLKRLRRSSKPTNPGSKNDGKIDIRHFPFSALDIFVMACSCPPQAREYRRTVTLLLASDILTFGTPGIFRLADWLVRALCVWIWVETVREYVLRVDVGIVQCARMSGWGILLACNWVHLWSVLLAVL